MKIFNILRFSHSKTTLQTTESRGKSKILCLHSGQFFEEKTIACCKTNLNKNNPGRMLFLPKHLNRRIKNKKRTEVLHLKCDSQTKL